MYGSETILWKQERFRIRVVQRDNLRGLLGIRMMDRAPNARMRELCGVTKRLVEMIDEGFLRWFGHVERMENDRIGKNFYVGECDGSLRKRRIDTMKDCLRKRGLDVKQARRMVQDRSEWRRFVRGNALSVAPGMNP